MLFLLYDQFAATNRYIILSHAFLSGIVDVGDNTYPAPQIDEGKVLWEFTI